MGLAGSCWLHCRLRMVGSRWLDFRLKLCRTGSGGGGGGGKGGGEVAGLRRFHCRLW